MKFELIEGRGTCLWQNGPNEQSVILHPAKKEIRMDYSQVLIIFDELLIPADHVGLVGHHGLTLIIPPDVPYMILNTSTVNITVELKESPASERILYDPYKFEHEDHSDYDPKEFQKSHNVPEGYVDTLPKWYSVKFTYPQFNYIFVRPSLGLSLQIHKMREEHWEILQGSPIIIADHKVYYNVHPGQKFSIPFGTFHTVINPSAIEWVLFKESYDGSFDENDIIRVFNPNHYK
jgi:mannose-6-phosphate isomerase-like protein (cupin superfamily)